MGSPTVVSSAGMDKGSPNFTICRTEYSPALGSVSKVQVAATGSMSRRTGTAPLA